MQPSGAFNRQEIYVGGRHLATYDSKTGATYFIHDDWQGTERVRSSMNAAAPSYETCTNLPYGDQQTCTGATDPSPLHYTGKMRDSETQLDYFGARYYSSGMGHWMSPDWADKPTSVPYANFGDPQSLNLYAMVTGNPVSKQDSDGHKLMDAFTGWSTGYANEGEGGGDPEKDAASLFQAPTEPASAPATPAPQQAPGSMSQQQSANLPLADSDHQHSITFRHVSGQDGNDFGHLTVQVDNNPEVGFGPRTNMTDAQIAANASVPGAVEPRASNATTIDAATIYVTGDGARAAQATITERTTNPGSYQPIGASCVDFGEQVGLEAGAHMPHDHIPESVIQDIRQQQIDAHSVQTQ